MDQIVLSYHDSLIRQSDYLLLDAPNWLNDKVIGFYFEYLERDKFSLEKERVCFITPDVTQFIKLYEGPELSIFLEPLMLSSKDVIVLLVNNNNSLVHSGGSHWSTLIYDRQLGVFEHYDSLSPSNGEQAQHCAQKLFHFIQGKSTLSYNEVKCPRQDNAYDCGVFALLFAEHVVKAKLCSNTELSLDSIVTGEAVRAWRPTTKELISSLRQS